MPSPAGLSAGEVALVASFGCRLVAGAVNSFRETRPSRSISSDLKFVDGLVPDSAAINGPSDPARRSDTKHSVDFMGKEKSGWDFDLLFV